MKICYPQNRSLLHLLYLFLICSFGIQLVLTYHWQGNELWDLEYSGSSFLDELATWTCPLLVNPSIKYSVCSDNTYIMGGYNVMGGSAANYYGNYWSKTYSVMIPHNQVSLAFNVYAIDSWEGTTTDDHFTISIDSLKIVGWHFNTLAGYQSCGGSSADFPAMKAYLTFPHTGSTLTLKFTNYLDESSINESLGIRDIQLNFVTVTAPVTSICGRSSNGAPLPAWACPCSATNEYMNPTNSGTCFPCHTSCATCTAGTATACTACYPGYYLSGSQCLQCSSNCLACSGSSTACASCNPGWFMVGTTCYPSCDPPLQQETVGSVIYCKTPCSGTYVMWDGSCSSTCAFSTASSTFTFSPATVNTFQECIFPCLSDQYLYFNSSCISTCPSPLTSLSSKSRGLCDYSCASSDYLYWNNSCMSTCPEPLSKETRGTYLPRKFCWYTCQPDQYLYWDETCQESCDFPLSPETQGVILARQFCWYTCQPDQYLYWNGSCLSICPSPLLAEVQGTRQFCRYTCQPDEYLYWNGSCLSTCPTPLSEETQGTNLPMKFCWFLCQPGEYLYWDETCLSDCPSPLTPETRGTNLPQQFCWYTCQPDQYLYWNGTCSSACPEPLTKTTYNGEWFCEYPCDSSKYLYWNGSCLDSCVSPLTLVTEGSPSRQFCRYLCPVDEFLYWDGSCQSSCNFPLVPHIEESPDRQLCFYQCNANDYLYWNGTCSSSCDSPLVQRTTNDLQFCDYSCESDKYLAFTGLCVDSCPHPLVVRIEGDTIKKSFCDYPCAKLEYLYENGSCETSCPSPYQSITEAGYKYCEKKSTTSSDPTNDNDAGFFEKAFLLAPKEAGATSLVCFVKNMHYIRYFDIEMPPRLERLVQSQPRNILTLQYGVTMPIRMIERFGEYSLMPIFQKPGTHSSFFVNYFQTFTSIAIGLFVGFCFQVFEKLSMKKGYKTWQAIFEVLRVIFKWNFCLILFAFNIDFVILFSFLEFETAGKSLGSGLSNFSFVTDIFMILTSVIFFIGLIYLLRKVSHKRARISPEPSTNIISTPENYSIVPCRWQSFRVLYTGFKETSTFARHFYLIYTIRIGLPILLMCCLCNSPMTQTTFQVFINFVLLLFILIARPIKNKINLIQLILFETLAFMMNVCILILTAIDIYNYDAQSSRVALGDAVIIGNSLTNLLSLLFLAIKLYLEIKIIIPLLPKMAKHEKYTSFAKLFFIVVQQGAMGFEAIFDELTSTDSTKNPPADQLATITTETGLRNSPTIKKRGAVLPPLSTEVDNIFDNYTTSARRLKDMTPGANLTFNDNTSHIGLKDNISQLAAEDKSYLGTQGDTSPILHRGNKNFASASGGPQKDFEPLFDNKSSPGYKLGLDVQKELSENSHENNEGQNHGKDASFIHPFSTSSAFSLDFSNLRPQSRQPGFGNRRLNQIRTNLLASGTLKINEEEIGASEVDDQIDEKTGKLSLEFA